MSLPKLKKLGNLARASAPLAGPLPTVKPFAPEPQEILPPVQEPSGSTWEQWLYPFLLRMSPYWEQQKKLKRSLATSDTSADFLNDPLRVVLYIDGPQHTIRHRLGLDLWLRMAWRSAGYKVVAWSFVTLQELQRNWARRYREDIG